MSERDGAPRLSWRDGMVALVLALAGGVFFGVAAGSHRISGLQANYAAHTFFLAIPIVWWIFGRRFPIGRFSHAQLRPWYLLWALAVIGQLAAALLSPPSTIHLPPAPVLVANLVFLALLVGPAEELLFRGLIQSGINASVHATFWLGRWPLHAGTAVAAILFGLWHLVNLSYQPLGATTAQVLTAAFVGWVIGIFYDRTKNLIGASILHNLIDFFGATTPVLAYFLIHRS